ncbi:hypothetical protein JYP46_01495 [Nitratireductor aquimarinus]|uniref:hypothetical protein n=1 Tax=Alphaproteobacteria TaxID=28211 RepID=UPI0019D3F312|nr:MULTISPECIES: hypothetical protein [Alphaproteobacteria]MBN7755485.1 hypothetical protein [Nitratireductor aquimarinus]MBY5998240.1 hypothetical protein [Tritonibacter mobilis]MBY6020268.1 hypothetical protein [Nitratireductor sp. DP7N14-4]
MTEQNKKAQDIECEIKRDFWDKDGVRHREGTTVTLPVEAALEGIESGALARIKKG